MSSQAHHLESDPVVQPGHEPSYPIRSVDRALELLLLFREHSAISVSEAAELLGVARSTAHRLLSMLQHRDFVRQEPRTKQYLAGPALVETGLAAVRQTDLRQVVRPHLERLVATVGETAHLQLRQGRFALFFDGVESDQAVRAAQRTGMSLPAHCTAGGKALLAALSPEQLHGLYEEPEQLAGLTPNSVADLPALERGLEEIRARGWARNDEESELGLRAVAAMIPDTGASTTMPAAITVAGPSFRMTDERIADIAVTVVAVARDIAASARARHDGVPA